MSDEKSEFDQVMAEIVAEAEPEAPAEGAVPEAEEEAVEETSEDESLEPAVAATDAAALGDLLEKGDLAGLAKALGKDPSIWKLNPKQFTAMRTGLRDAKRLAAEGAAAKAEGARVIAAAQREYGAIVRAIQARKAGDHSGVRAALEQLFEDKFETVVGEQARFAKGLDPGQLEVQKLRRELAERDAKAAEEAKRQSDAQIETSQVSTVAGRLKGTPLEGVDGAAEQIVQVVRASWNGVGYTKTLQEAYADVKRDLAGKAAKLAKLAAPAKPKAPATPPATKPLAPIRSDKPLTKAQIKAQEQAEFKAVLKEAEAAVAKSERTNRRQK